MTGDQAETQGRIHHFLGSHLLPPRTHYITTPSHISTDIALTPSSLFISTKRGRILRYSLPSFRRVGKPFGQVQFTGSNGHAIIDGRQGHMGEILCLAATEDGEWLVSGGRDRVVGVWNVENDVPSWVTGMRGHKDAVTVSPFFEFCKIQAPNLDASS